MAPARSETTAPIQPLSEADAPERIECVCSRKPLLARAGRMRGKAFLWIKNVRARFDITVTSGEVRIKCRECNRYHTIVIGEVVESTVD